ncbi:MAG: hypothetical protein NWF09_07710 [Candidatus Bathyarchaeota archaeon]|nr:hypothetical protein [Candidatus Bathyarchaeota archaeon]
MNVAYLFWNAIPMHGVIKYGEYTWEIKVDDRYVRYSEHSSEMLVWDMQENTLHVKKPRRLSSNIFCILIEAGINIFRRNQRFFLCFDGRIENYELLDEAKIILSRHGTPLKIKQAKLYFDNKSRYIHEFYEKAQLISETKPYLYFKLNDGVDVCMLFYYGGIDNVLLIERKGSDIEIYRSRIKHQTICSLLVKRNLQKAIKIRNKIKEEGFNTPINMLNQLDVDINSLPKIFQSIFHISNIF